MNTYKYAYIRRTWRYIALNKFEYEHTYININTYKYEHIYEEYMVLQGGEDS